MHKFELLNLIKIVFKFYLDIYPVLPCCLLKLESQQAYHCDDQIPDVLCFFPPNWRGSVENEHPVLFCPSHNCGYDADGDSGQEGVQRPGYRGELHPGYLQYILPAAYLLHSHRVLVLTWGLSVSMWPQMTSTFFSNLSYSGRLLVLVGTIFLIINKALD